MPANTSAKTLSQVDTVTPESSTFIAIASPTTGSMYKATAASVVKAGLGPITAGRVLVSNSAGTGFSWGSTVAGFSIDDSVTSYTFPIYASTIVGYINITSSKSVSVISTAYAVEILKPNGANYAIRLASNSNIEVFYLDNVRRIYGSVYINNCSSFKSLSAGYLDEVVGPITITSNSALYTVYGSWEFYSLRRVGGITYTGNPNTAGSRFPFPALEVVSGSVNASNNNFTSSQVDYVLYVLGRLDGTNGKCLYGSGLTVNVGGNNAAPGTSDTLGGKTGMEWVDVLVARGATVTHN